MISSGLRAGFRIRIDLMRIRISTTTKNYTLVVIASWKKIKQ
jgi:hypothetical protein